MSLLALLVAVSCTAGPAAKPLRYVALGASDSVGDGASDPTTKSWPALVAAAMPAGTVYTNLGVSGSTVAQAFTQQLPTAMTADPDVVTVWLAFNDLAHATAPAAYKADPGRLLDGLLQTKAPLFVGNLPDLRGGPATSGIGSALPAAARDGDNRPDAAP